MLTLQPLLRSPRIAACCGVLLAATISVTVGSAQTAYSIDTSGDWTAAATWSPAATEGTGPTASDQIFITGMTGTRTVNLRSTVANTAYAIGSITFNDTFNATFQGEGSATAVLSIAGDITKQNTGSLIFRNQNGGRNVTINVGGDIVVEGGVLDLGAAGLANILALNLSGNTTVKSGAELRLGLLSGTNLGSVTLATGSALRFGSNASATLSMSDFNGGGSVTVLANNNDTRTMTLALSASAGNHLHSGSILRDTTTRPVGLAVTKTGAGRQTLTGVTDFTGAVTINEGVLEFSGSSSLGTGNINLAGGVLGLGTGDLVRTLGTGNGQIRLTAGNSGFAAYGADRLVTLDANADLAWTTLTTGSNLRLGHDTATHKLTLTNALNLANAARTVTTGDGAAAVDAELAGVISGTGSSALIKAGTGTLSLTAANTYVGGTTISAGTLLANNTTGSATGSGAVNIAAGATLGGGGDVDGLVTTAGSASVIRAGGVTNTLTLAGGLNAASGATFELTLGTVSTRVDIGAFNGSTNSGDLTFDITGAAGIASGATYTLLGFSSALGLDYSDLALSSESISAGYVLDSSFGNGGWLINADSLQVRFSSVAAAIPEPSSFALIAGVVLGAVAAFRRSRR